MSATDPANTAVAQIIVHTVIDVHGKVISIPNWPEVADIIRTAYAETQRKSEAAENLAEALEASKRHHLVVDEDYFYSCPLGVDDEGFRAYAGDETKCNCGAEAHNTRIDEALQAYRNPRP